MINLVANKKKFSLPQSWGEITLGTYIEIVKQDITNDKVIQILSGLPMEYITGNENAFLIYLDWLKTDIDSKNWVNPFPIDIKEKTLAQLFSLEMCANSPTKIIEAIGIYFEDFKPLEMLLSDCIGLVNDLFKQLEDYHKQEESHLYFKATSEQIRAGIDKFNKFGRMNTIDSLSGRYQLKYEEVEQLEVNTAFGMLLRIKLENDYQRNYSAIMSEK